MQIVISISAWQMRRAHCRKLGWLIDEFPKSRVTMKKNKPMSLSVPPPSHSFYNKCKKIIFKIHLLGTQQNTQFETHRDFRNPIVHCWVSKIKN